MNGAPAALPFDPITPLSWKGTEPVKQRSLAHGRIPSGDLTILSGNGGSGKTEIANSLLVSVAADLGDWLGCTVEAGPVLFVSCEEPEENIRSRIHIVAERCGTERAFRGIRLLGISPQRNIELCAARRLRFPNPSRRPN